MCTEKPTLVDVATYSGFFLTLFWLELSRQKFYQIIIIIILETYVLVF